MDLSRRYQEILRALIREFVRTGDPIGSRRLAKISKEGLSSATIRNVVADLEEMGYVTKPHTSAGRIPTPQGYRFFVDKLSNTRQLSDRQVDRIRKTLEEERTPGELMSKTSQVLSRISDNVGFVLAPPASSLVMKHIELVKISPHRILVILVTQAGTVQHKVIRAEEELTQKDLDRANSYLLTHFKGETLTAIRSRLLGLKENKKAIYARMLQAVVLLGSQEIVKEPISESEHQVYLGGTSHILEKDVAESQKISLFQTFEEKKRLAKTLAECVRTDKSEPTVVIGLEKHLPEMKDFSLVSAPYTYDQRTTGTLGILGPSRMEYEKAIGLVDFVAKLFGSLLTETPRQN
jgi:heat-inducible transcriptional repressor